MEILGAYLKRGALRCPLLAVALSALAAGCVPPTDPVIIGPVSGVVALHGQTRANWKERAASLDPGELQEIETRARAIRTAPGSVFVSYSRHGTVHHLWAPFAGIPIDAPTSAGPVARAAAFLEASAGLFGLRSAAGLRPLEEPWGVRSDAGDGAVALRYEQVAGDGRPVFGSSLTLLFDAEGRLRSLTAALVPAAALSSEAPRLSPEEAAEKVGGDPATAVWGHHDATLFGGSEPRVEIAWRLVVGHPASGTLAYVDAMNGEVLSQSEIAVGDARRQIFHCPGCSSPGLPGSLQWSDLCVPPPLPPATEPAACLSPDLICVDTLRGPCLRAPDGTMAGSSKAIRDYLGSAQELYGILGRDGWDDLHGSPFHRTRASADADAPGSTFEACDATWLPLGSPVPGAGGAQLVFGSGRACPDVVGHEYTHAVTEATVGLSTDGCAAAKAIEEGIADVFGELVEVRVAGTADWRRGTGCLTCPRDTNFSVPSRRQINCARGLRSTCGAVLGLGGGLATPPDSWADYRPECSGYFNSSIVAKVGHLMGREASDGALDHGGLRVTGLGATTAAEVWYRALYSGLSGSSQLSGFRSAMLTACGRAAPVSSVAGCADAVEAVGLWSPDVVEAFELPVVVTDPPPGAASRRFAALGEVGGTPVLVSQRREPGGGGGSFREIVEYRRRPCSLLDDCGWDPPLTMARPFVGPDQLLPGTPAVAAQDTDTLWICWRTISGFDCTEMNPGGTRPAIATTVGGINSDLSLAFFDGQLFVAYSGPRNRAWWSRWTVGDPAGFSAPQPLRAGSREVEVRQPPVLAAGELDPATGMRGLFMAYVERSDGEVGVVRFSSGRGDWSGGWGPAFGAPRRRPGELDEPIFTLSRPALAVHRGRLHLAVREALVIPRVTPDPAGGLWILSSAPPFGRFESSEVVLQEGSFRPEMSFWAGAGALHLLHLAPDERHPVRRFKVGR